jgi:hypothetical protein
LEVLMSPLRLLTPRPSILPAIILLYPNVNQFVKQKSTVASKEQKHVAPDRPSQCNLGRVNDQSGGGPVPCPPNEVPRPFCPHGALVDCERFRKAPNQAVT